MTQINEPTVNARILGAQTTVQNEQQRIVLRGQQSSAGTYTAGELVSNPSKLDLKTNAGARSMLFDMYNATQKVLKNACPIDLIVEDDPVGAAAQGKIVWNGTATAAGQYTVTIGSERNGKFVVAVSSGDAATDVVSTANDAADLLLECPWTADIGAVTSELEIDATNDGTEGNFIPIKVEGSVPGLTYTITGMAGGAGVVATRDLEAVVSGIRYQTVVQPGTYPSADITTGLLEDRWNVDNDILDGVGITNIVDTKANVIADLSSKNYKTFWHLSDKPMTKTDYVGPSQLEYPWGPSCMIAGARARRLTPGADISDLVDSKSGTLDSVGGPAIASLPYTNTPLPIPVQPAGYGFSKTELTEINTAGGSVIGRNSAGTATIIGKAKTTYLTNSSGDPDDSYEYVNYVDTTSSAREYSFNNIKAACRQSRLTEGSLIEGRNFQNRESLTRKMMQYFGVLSGRDYCLYQAGETIRKFYIKNLKVVIDMSQGQATITEVMPIVTQLRTIFILSTFTFSVGE